MKSQDILLLLKLVSLERQAHVATESVSISLIDRALEPPGTDTFDDDAGNARPFQLDMEPDPYSVRGLSSAIGISRSEVSNALGRCYANSLAKPQRHGDGPAVNRRGLEEFLAYGIRFVFPVQMQGLTRGIPTGLTAPIFDGILRHTGEYGPVWADPHGTAPGFAVEPLYKTVTTAARKDETLYRLLAIVDSIRLGHPRERKLAITELHGLLDF